MSEDKVTISFHEINENFPTGCHCQKHGNKDEPAFPANFYAQTQSLHPFSGLTKREWFAAMASEEDIEAAWKKLSTAIPEGFTASRAEVRFFHAIEMIEASRK